MGVGAEIRERCKCSEGHKTRDGGNPHNEVPLSHLTDEETEVQRGLMAFPSSHSQLVVEPRFESRPQSSAVSGHLIGLLNSLSF